jgi:hypothetical protein
VPTDWSRDGRYLLGTNNGDLWILTDGKSNPFQSTEFNESEGQFSADGTIARQAAAVGVVGDRRPLHVDSFPEGSRSILRPLLPAIG